MASCRTETHNRQQIVFRESLKQFKLQESRAKFKNTCLKLCTGKKINSKTKLLVTRREFSPGHREPAPISEQNKFKTGLLSSMQKEISKGIF